MLLEFLNVVMRVSVVVFFVGGFVIVFEIQFRVIMKLGYRLESINIMFMYWGVVVVVVVVRIKLVVVKYIGMVICQYCFEVWFECQVLVYVSIVVRVQGGMVRNSEVILLQFNVLIMDGKKLVMEVVKMMKKSRNIQRNLVS